MRSSCRTRPSWLDRPSDLPPRPTAPWGIALLAAALIAAGCTLDIVAPLLPPPETWDPALNTHPDGAEFQRLLDRYAREGIPGIVLYVETPQGLWNGAAGFAKAETGDPMLPTHRHHSASIAKMYTATAVLLLADEGLLDLDSGISTYLPRDVWSPIPNASAATVRQLLSHRSGIPDFDGTLTYDLDFLNDPLASHSPAKLLSYLHGQSAWFDPDSRYGYCNANYFLLAMVVDEVTAGSHADVISERILAPLGLDATYYRNEAGYPTPPGLVNSYQDVAGDGRIMNVTDIVTNGSRIFFGHAGLIATSADYAAFLNALLVGEILGPEMLTQMLERPDAGSYGLGLSFTDTPYGTAVGHSGGDMGVRGQVRYFPDHDATIVLLSNGGDGGLPGRLFNELWGEVMTAALGGL